MSDNDKPIPYYAKFIVGGVGGMTSAWIVHPLDFLKTTMQMSGRKGEAKLYTSTFDAIVKIYKKRGIFGFYPGATATLLRQATYTTSRLGIYTSLFEALSKDGEPPPFALKAVIGMIGGMCGGFVGTPADLCLIRMVSDHTKPASERFNYRNVIVALVTIVRDEGFLRLFRGGVPTVVRAIAVNGTLLATYSQSKSLLLETNYFNDDLLLYFSASMISGFITAVVSLPIDIIKTRLQTSKSSGKEGIPSVFLGIVKNEGVPAFWKGFVPYFARIAPITILTFIFVEKLSYWYQIYILGNKHVKKSL